MDEICALWTALLRSKLFVVKRNQKEISFLECFDSVPRHSWSEECPNHVGNRYSQLRVPVKGQYPTNWWIVTIPWEVQGVCPFDWHKSCPRQSWTECGVCFGWGPYPEHTGQRSCWTHWGFWRRMRSLLSSSSDPSFNSVKPCNYNQSRHIYEQHYY